MGEGQELLTLCTQERPRQKRQDELDLQTAFNASLSPREWLSSGSGAWDTQQELHHKINIFNQLCQR